VRIEFKIDADGEYHEMELKLPVEKRIYQLRLDVGDGVSKAAIAGLKLIDSRGKPVMSWPQSRNDE
jgi:hypothetical protein